jgi:hypothetical protein
MPCCFGFPVCCWRLPHGPGTCILWVVCRPVLLLHLLSASRLRRNVRKNSCLQLRVHVLRSQVHAWALCAAH